MKLTILIALFGACAVSALPQNYFGQQQQYRPQAYYQESTRPRAALERNAQILRSVSDVNEQGYNFAYDTENGIQADETGQEADGIQAAGGYSYTGDDGQVYTIRYTAGANGFQAQGAHIPTPPPIPEAIAKALQENARDEAAGIFDDGSYKGEFNSGVVAARAYQPNRQFAAPGFRSRY